MAFSVIPITHLKHKLGIFVRQNPNQSKGIARKDKLRSSCLISRLAPISQGFLCDSRLVWLYLKGLEGDIYYILSFIGIYPVYYKLTQLL